MAQETHTRVSGTWKKVTDPQVRVSGAWKKVQQIYSRVSGVWQIVYQRYITWSQEQKVQVTSPAQSNEMGWDVGISGDSMIAGIHRRTVVGNTEAGSAVIFTRSGTTWTQQQEINASNYGFDDNFGWAVAIDGDVAMVSAIFQDTTVANSGSVYEFTRSGSTWTQQQEIQSSDIQNNDQFGHDIALDGNYMIVGVPEEDTGAAQAGSAYIFLNTTTWTQQQKLQKSGTKTNLDRFGVSVDIDGTSCIIGATRDNTARSGKGNAYVFTRSGTTWTQQQELSASDEGNGDYFGWSVAIKGDTCVVGAYNEAAGGTDAGAAYVFTRSGSTWTEQQKLVASDASAGDEFGYRVAVNDDENLIMVSAPEAPGADTSTGAIYVFTLVGSIWTEQQILTASDAQNSDVFGRAMELDGTTLAVGAHLEDTTQTSAGSAYIFVED